jgi:NAD(P)-dependent dehydrogenase (short-subunit alcohol dehydrogenase family)
LFANDGAQILISDLSYDNAEATAAEIRAKAGDVRAGGGGISVEAEVIAIVEKTIETFGRIDGSVNNAGVAGPDAHASGGTRTGTQEGPRISSLFIPRLSTSCCDHN